MAQSKHSLPSTSMKIYPYQTPEGIIELVEKREYDKLLELAETRRQTAQNYYQQSLASEDRATKNLREVERLEPANAELIERLAEARESHLHASARDVQTIQRQRVMLERMADDLRGIANMPEYDQDDAHRLRNIASKALSAYESANLEPVANPLDEAVRRIEAVPIHDLKMAYRRGSEILGLQCDGVQAVRARLIAAAKGES